MNVRAGHVLVVGAGGIGCPAAWGLSSAGVEHITIVDGDVIERSNLPRQIWFTDDDVGTSKAEKVARSILRSDDLPPLRAVHARLDDSTLDELTDGVDVLVDATDGATTKDWLNHAAVQRGIPLVHAAGLRSEARLLVVPAGGRPCLACLFGRLTEETGSCADLGVWNGVVGVIGFLAADAAVRVLAGDVPRPTYDVLDFAAGRAMSLEAGADDACPVCADATGGIAPYPDPAACAVPMPATIADVAVDQTLDLRDVRCPMNLLRARQALAAADVGAVVEFQLGAEGAATVPEGVRVLGHAVVHDTPHGDGRLLRVRVAHVPDETSWWTSDDLELFARQLVLPDLGPKGQRRLGEASVVVQGDGSPLAVALIYLRRAGVGAVKKDARPGPLRAVIGETTWRVTDDDGLRVVSSDGEGPDAMTLPHAAGALLADRVQRAIVDPQRAAPSLTLSGCPGTPARRS